MRNIRNKFLILCGLFTAAILYNWTSVITSISLGLPWWSITALLLIAAAVWEASEYAIPWIRLRFMRWRDEHGRH